MLIHGGIFENGKITNETLILEFSNLKWNKLEVKPNKSPHLSFHCSEFVLENENPKNHLFHVYKGLPINNEFRQTNKLKYEGIYIFGGIDDEKNYKNDIYILKLGKKPCEWIYPKTNGISPVPRIMAKINYYQDLSILILHGGRNDSIKKSIFNDIFVLDLMTLNWIQTSTYPSVPKDRSEHSSVVYNNQIFILGGINLKKYYPMDFFVINVDLYNNKFKESEKYKEYDLRNKSPEKYRKTEESEMKDDLNYFK